MDGSFPQGSGNFTNTVSAQQQQLMQQFNQVSSTLQQLGISAQQLALLQQMQVASTLQIRPPQSVSQPVPPLTRNIPPLEPPLTPASHFLTPPLHVSSQVAQRFVGEGVVSELHGHYGVVNNEVFFEPSAVRGRMPKVGDNVTMDCEFRQNLGFVWTAVMVAVFPTSTNSAEQSHTPEQSYQHGHKTRGSASATSSRDHSKSSRKTEPAAKVISHAVHRRTSDRGDRQVIARSGPHDVELVISRELKRSGSHTRRPRSRSSHRDNSTSKGHNNRSRSREVKRSRPSERSTKSSPKHPGSRRHRSERSGVEQSTDGVWVKPLDSALTSPERQRSRSRDHLKAASQEIRRSARDIPGPSQMATSQPRIPDGGELLDLLKLHSREMTGDQRPESIESLSPERVGGTIEDEKLHPVDEYSKLSKDDLIRRLVISEKLHKCAEIEVENLRSRNDVIEKSRSCTEKQLDETLKEIEMLSETIKKHRNCDKKRLETAKRDRASRPPPSDSILYGNPEQIGLRTDASVAASPFASMTWSVALTDQGKSDKAMLENIIEKYTACETAGSFRPNCKGLVYIDANHKQEDSKIQVEQYYTGACAHAIATGLSWINYNMDTLKSLIDHNFKNLSGGAKEQITELFAQTKDASPLRECLWLLADKFMHGEAEREKLVSKDQIAEKLIQASKVVDDSTSQLTPPKTYKEACSLSEQIQQESSAPILNPGAPSDSDPTEAVPRLNYESEPDLELTAVSLGSLSPEISEVPRSRAGSAPNLKPSERVAKLVDALLAEIDGEEAEELIPVIDLSDEEEPDTPQEPETDWNYSPPEMQSCNKQWTLVIRSLNPNTSEKVVTDYFSRFGKVVQVVVLRGKQYRSNRSGFVSFNTFEGAHAAMQVKTGHLIDGKQCWTRMCATEEQIAAQVQQTQQPTSRGDRKLMIGALNPLTEEPSLWTFYKQFGDVVQVSVQRDAKRKSRRFGFVTFLTVESAQAALKVRPHMIDGRQVKAHLAGSKVPRNVKAARQVPKSRQQEPKQQSTSTPSIFSGASLSKPAELLKQSDPKTGPQFSVGISNMELEAVSSEEESDDILDSVTESLNSALTGTEVCERVSGVVSATAEGSNVSISTVSEVTSAGIEPQTPDKLKPYTPSVCKINWN